MIKREEEELRAILAQECYVLNITLDLDFTTDDLRRVIPEAKLNEIYETGDLQKRTEYTCISLGLFNQLYPLPKSHLAIRFRRALHNKHKNLLAASKAMENGL